MLKIDIAMIRKNANSLVALNEGYVLYQNKQYKNINLKKDTSMNYDFVIEGNVDDIDNISLFVGDTVRGKCDCNLKGLCKHEICLFFVLRDKLNEISNNAEEINKLELGLKADKYLSSIYRSTMVSSLESMKLIPTVYYNEQLMLSLEIVVENRKYKIKDTKEFIRSYFQREEYDFDGLKLKIGPNNFDNTSKEFISILKYLDIVDTDKILLDNNMIDEIYKLYNESILFNNGYYTREYYFTLEHPNLKFYIEDMTLYLENRENYLLLASTEHQYIFYKNNIHVLNNKYEYYLTLKHLKNNNKIEFDTEGYNNFLVNVYPYIKDEVIDIPYCFDLDINSYIDYSFNKLKVAYKTNIEENIMFIKRDNYLKLLSKFKLTKENNYTIYEFDKICDFVKYAIKELECYGKVYISEDVKNIKINKMKPINLNLKLEGGIISILYDEKTYSNLETEKMFLAYKEKKKYVELDNQIVEIDYDQFDEYEEILNDLDIKKFNGTNLKLYQIYYLNEKYKKTISINKELSKFIDDMLDYSNISIDLNDNIKDVLRDYQISGYKWLKTLSKYKFGGILADDMGLGKTLQIIALIDSLEKNKPSIIISPTSLIFNWESEFRKFAPNIKTKVIYGINRTDEEIKEALLNNYVLIMSYETLRIDIEKYKNTDFLMCVVDEAQYIKNPDALKTIAVKSLRSDIRFALTGTPIENSLLDLWSIFDFVLPGYLGTKSMFVSKYESFKDNHSLLNDLNKKISLFMLRRLKGDVLNLEDKIENYAYSTMSKEEKKLYDSYLLDAKSVVQNSDYNMTKVLSVLTRLRQIACEPRLFIDNVDAPNSKINLLMEIVEEKILDNHKILIFSQFTSLFKFIGERLEKSNIKYLELTGSTKVTQRQELVTRFNEDKEIGVFLISLKAGGTGLNLTSADVVIHFDPWWNLAAMNQATDRAHRIGQDKVVHVIKMINKDTIEEKIVELQNQKKFLSDTVITEDEVIKKMNKEDLKKLFN